MRYEHVTCHGGLLGSDCYARTCGGGVAGAKVSVNDCETVRPVIEHLYRFLFIGICWLGQGTVKCTPLVAEPAIKITKVSPSGNITLEIGNHSKEPLKLWEESNNWGTARWRILRIRHGQIEAFFQNPYQIFTVNFPTVDEIAAGGQGTFIVTHGKTAAARRVLPMTPRVRTILEDRWEKAGELLEGWVWPAQTRSGHVESSSLKKQHARTFKTLSEEAKKSDAKPVRKFVLYSLRHTFLTRLGESGCDAWTLARIAGHSSIAMSTRYVHPSEDAVFTAMERLAGHKIGHTAEAVNSERSTRKRLPS